MTATDPSALPQWKGRPVPWVTRWSGQIYDTRAPAEQFDQGVNPFRAVLVQDRRTGRPAFTYRDPLEYRDASGVLWLKEGAGRTGEPQWKMVSTNRQRTCMTKRLCQVCGTKIPEGPTPWIVDGLEWEAFEEARAKKAPILTVTTPVCPDCIDLATSLCPQLLRAGFKLLRVDAYDLWGVHGETLMNGRKVLGAVGYDEPVRLPFTIARQQLVELLDYTEIEEWT